jgi:hypothetical protein
MIGEAHNIKYIIVRGGNRQLDAAVFCFYCFLYLSRRYSHIVTFYYNFFDCRHEKTHLSSNFLSTQNILYNPVQNHYNMQFPKNLNDFQF